MKSVLRKSLPLFTFVLGVGLTLAATTHAQRAPATPAAASVVEREASELRIAPNGKASIRLLARGNNAFVGMLWMDGGGGVPEHRDPTEEYIHILEGGGQLTIDGKTHTIGPGTTILMPPNSLVSYVNGPKPLRALQVFAGPGPSAKYAKWKSTKATNPGRRGRTR